MIHRGRGVITGLKTQLAVNIIIIQLHESCMGMWLIPQAMPMMTPMASPPVSARDIDTAGPNN